MQLNISAKGAYESSPFCDGVKMKENPMFIREDNTYNDIREKSLIQWLTEMEQHEDIAVRGGVKLCREYMEHLKQQKENLKHEIALKNEYLKKMSKRK